MAIAGIIVDGQTVDGDAIVYSHDSMTPSSVRFDDHRTAFAIGPDFHGRFALQVWDADAAALRDAHAVRGGVPRATVVDGRVLLQATLLDAPDSW